MLDRLLRRALVGGKATLPYDMFAPGRFDIEARSARVLERIYHKGQQFAWDGRDVLDKLIEEHGPPQLDRRRREALGRLFAIIMWGELAAWKVSTQLADELQPLEAKMAATSQAFDEARHFYVMHDYLVALGAMPERVDPWTERLLMDVMGADHLAKKLLGMQLMVEPVALSIFHIVRKSELEPVLSALMPYYERDEARHVALGVKYMPTLIRGMNVRERAELFAFQAWLLSLEIGGNVAIMRDLQALGLPSRMLADIARAKQMKALELMMEEMGLDSSIPMTVLERYAGTLMEATVREDGETLREKIRRVYGVLRHGMDYGDMGVDPDITDAQTPYIRAA